MIAHGPILHLVLLNLKPSPDSPAGTRTGTRLGKPAEAAVRAVLAAFARLADIDGVLHLGAAQAASDDSTHSLAMFALLRDATALEEFGTHPRHIEYLQSAVLPRVSDLATADVVVAETPPASYRAAACFCASFQPTTFDWQVRSLFEAASQVPGNTTVGGLAANERQRFRAAGIALWPDPDDWAPGNRSDALRRLWIDCWGPAATDRAWVVGPATPLGPAVSGAIP
jgi:hypothetical protein